MSEARVMEDVLFCWSGGKDSAMALHALREARACSVAALLTTITDEYDRISMHGVRRASWNGRPNHSACRSIRS